MASFSLQLQPVDEEMDSISPLMFGAIQTGFQHFSGFRTAMDSLSLTHVRWPGGTLAEQRTDVYGLEIDGLFDATNLYAFDPGRVRPDLEEMMEYAVERSVPLTIIIPTARYSTDLERGTAELQAFVGKLLLGEYGDLPEHLILQIGNEYAFQPEFSGNAELYGILANEFILTIVSAINSFPAAALPRIDIALQMGINHSDDVAIRSEITHPAMAAVDILTFNHLPISLTNAHRITSTGHPEDVGENRFTQSSDNYRNWIEALSSVPGDTSRPELFLSAWTVGSSAIQLSEVNPAFNDYGLRAASTAIDMIYNYSRIGVDMAAVWGVDVINLNRLSLVTSDQISISHFGKAVGMMAERIVGAVALPGSEGYQRTDLGNIYAFQSAEKLILYVTVNDIPESGKLVSVDLKGVAPMWEMTGRLLESDASVSSQGSSAQGAPEEEVPSISSFVPIFEGGSLNLWFSQDYSVAEIVIDLPAAAQWGSAVAEVIRATEEDNFLFGFEGNDVLVGRSGDDYLHGGQGDDTLFGGAGSNVLIGGEGADHFVFEAGDGCHTVLDFQPGLDLLNVGGMIERVSRGSADFGEMISNFLNDLGENQQLSIASHSTPTGSEVIITSRYGSIIAHLDGVEANTLGADDFFFS